MTNPLPIIIFGGGALLLLSGKKRRAKRMPPETRPAPPLPELEDKDLDEADREEAARPIPTPAPSPAPLPIPSPIPVPEPIPSPSPPISPESPYKPPIGPTAVGLCVNEVYARDPEYLSDIPVAPKALTAFGESDYYFYIRRSMQEKLYNYMLQRFTAMKQGQERPTVASVILREALKHFNSGCKWELPIDSLSEPESLVWQGARRLAIMAQITAGVSDPGFKELFKTGNRYSITRDSLGEPDPGFFGAQKKPSPDTRIEILVTDPSQENAEHIIGKVLKLTGPNGEKDQFEVLILDSFQGGDVKPRLRTKHGFKAGSNAYFSQKGPTGIYRIFPEGME